MECASMGYIPTNNGMFGGETALTGWLIVRTRRNITICSIQDRSELSPHYWQTNSNWLICASGVVLL